MGIAKSHEAMADADVVLLVVDATVGLSAEDRAVLRRNSAGMLVVWNKSDLVGTGTAVDNDVAEARNGTASVVGRATRALATSAVTGEGIDALRSAIVRSVAGGEGGVREAGMLTNLRQHQSVQQALHGLDVAGKAVAQSIPHEMVLLDLYDALRGLDALTGATTTEDVLRLIFSTFCIGK